MKYKFIQYQYKKMTVSYNTGLTPTALTTEGLHLVINKFHLFLYDIC